ncbi:DUF6382 domain-containing protein [Cohnella luojiensis]|nr:DUF6382 domain-containing protein [Cohnella luojiensis]
MIIERDPPFSCEELNEIQLHMLKQCEIPGLLPMETEEFDGRVSLRYSLSGTRMLTEATRTTNWSMSDMMGALCRLAEVLEECRLYLLDADRVRLQEEYIFVGNDWHDLNFTYLPIDMPTLHRADDLERLIIKWMMKVQEPDGHVLQNVLRLVASTGFTPIVLSRYCKQYLANVLKGEGERRNQSQAPSVSDIPIANMPLAERKPIPAKPSRSWDLLQPISGELHSVSEMWGDMAEPAVRSMQRASSEGGPNSADDQREEDLDIGKWRIIVVCLMIFLNAIIWRFLYLSQPSEQKFLLCLCLTLVSVAGGLLLWKGKPGWMSKRERVRESSNKMKMEAFESSWRESGMEYGERAIPRFPAPELRGSMLSNMPDPFPANDSLLQEDNNSAIAATSWLSSANDRTTFLEHTPKSEADTCFLVWSTKDAGFRIPLQGKSLVIGRSADAAQHVDDSMGISRAHVELLRVSEQWKVKDLGSRNGTRLNDKPMAPYELYALQAGDCLKLANSQYQFQQAE